ncbi:MAG: hypothetical protein N2749_02430 [Clostridia bacterium]|nr:hypothetical protein [Clostridia bacterium]
MLELILPLIVLGFVLLVGAIALLVVRKKTDSRSTKKDGKSSANVSSQEDNSHSYKKSNASNIHKDDIFKFMEFDKIMDDMVVQSNGTKYTMAIKCKGINYDLMSEVEQLAVEEGFITFLNTIRFPIQIYVQAQNIDLKKSVKIYNDRLVDVRNQFEEINERYNRAVNSLDSTDEEIKVLERERTSIQNVLEYATDIVRYVEKLSLNKSLLQRNFYVLVSYHSSEITASSNFKQDEITSICYNELYTRAQSVISALSACSVSGTVLNSNQLAELLYSSYNRDDKNYLSIEQALEAGFYRLYSTSKDAFDKRNELIKSTIEEEARIRATEALRKAIEEGSYTTKEMLEEEYDEEVSKRAIDLVKNQKVSEDIKTKAKKTIIEEYREEKRKRVAKKELQEKPKQEAENSSSNLEENNINNDTNEEQINGASNENIVTNKKPDESDDSIV